ncbi:unnamed protein product [Protopolystoma xenopodis]|uniref:Uncharacterized protein n=1 Tax=Protopolystoma xenopodis TaxID=117903 RepID=A0A3S5B1E1_9PLAT|nr:unnamed protein product [Protopolystoma xenopodis]
MNASQTHRVCGAVRVLSPLFDGQLCPALPSSGQARPYQVGGRKENRSACFLFENRSQRESGELVPRSVIGQIVRTADTLLLGRAANRECRQDGRVRLSTRDWLDEGTWRVEKRSIFPGLV